MEINGINNLQYEGIKKPSIKDTLKYGIKSTVHARKAATKDVFVTAAGIGASVGAAAAVKNSKTAQTYIKKGIEWAAGTGAGKAVAKAATKVTPYITKATKWVKGLPGPAKLVLGAGAAITALLHANNRTKTYYEQGKIDQEYRDLSKK